MDSGLRARRGHAPQTTKWSGRFNGLEILMFGLIALALVDCTVIGVLVAHGLGN